MFLVSLSIWRIKKLHKVSPVEPHILIHTTHARTQVLSHNITVFGFFIKLFTIWRIQKLPLINPTKPHTRALGACDNRLRSAGVARNAEAPPRPWRCYRDSKNTWLLCVYKQTSPACRYTRVVISPNLLPAGVIVWRWWVGIYNLLLMLTSTPNCRCCCCRHRLITGR